MPLWTSQKPCKNCGNKAGTMIRCTNCQTVGCERCVGLFPKGNCPICKKTTTKVKI